MVFWVCCACTEAWPQPNLTPLGRIGTATVAPTSVSNLTNAPGAGTNPCDQFQKVLWKSFSFFFFRRVEAFIAAYIQTCRSNGPASTHSGLCSVFGTGHKRGKYAQSTSLLRVKLDRTYPCCPLFLLSLWSHYLYSGVKLGFVMQGAVESPCACVCSSTSGSVECFVL